MWGEESKQIWGKGSKVEPWKARKILSDNSTMVDAG